MLSIPAWNAFLQPLEAPPAPPTRPPPRCCAAPLAAAIKIKDRLQGKKVALVLSGGNISLYQLRAALG